jgi:hypothetical protein
VSRSRLARDGRSLLHARIWAAIVSSSCCHNLEAWREVHLSSSGVLLIPYPLISGIFLVFGAAPKYAYKIVVTIPTKNRLVFSPLDFEGRILCSGRVSWGGKSRVGACSAFGSIVRAFIPQRTLGPPGSCTLRRILQKKRLHAFPKVDK